MVYGWKSIWTINFSNSITYFQALRRSNTVPDPVEDPRRAICTEQLPLLETGSAGTPMAALGLVGS